MKMAYSKEEILKYTNQMSYRSKVNHQQYKSK